MPLSHLSITDFRCIRTAELEISSGNNLLFGANASGKTSVLEAIAYLGRGRSFRGAATSGLIRHGCSAFTLLGKVLSGQRTRSVGVRNSRAGLEIHIDGDRGSGAAVLAEALPLQIIDPDIHDLVAAGPDARRRYLDWIAFHVEHGFLGSWQRFRRALKQRNAALRAGAGAAELLGWDREFCVAAGELDGARQRAVALLRPTLENTGQQLLGGVVGVEYRRGWPADQELPEVLAAGLDRDRQHGASQVGPQRADLRLIYDDRQARKQVSRGQQKLLACSLVLAATEVVQAGLQRPLLLLVDDPAAELDAGSLKRLMGAVAALGSQVIASSLEADARLFSGSPALFHVEQGVLLPQR